MYCLQQQLTNHLKAANSKQTNKIEAAAAHKTLNLVQLNTHGRAGRRGGRNPARTARSFLNDIGLLLVQPNCNRT